MSSHRSPTAVYERADAVSNGPPHGNGSIRISPKTAGLILTLIITVGGGLTSGIALVRWLIKLEAEVEVAREWRLENRRRVDSITTAHTEFRIRVNSVLTDQERRLRALEGRRED